MNQEVLDLSIKKVKISDAEMVHGIGVNSNGNYLGVYISNASGAFVLIYRIQDLAVSDQAVPAYKTRVGTDVGTKGRAFEWNPAFPDIFAASASDNSVLVVKLDFDKTSLVSIVGNKKLGATGLFISWSPKGKQLVVGDSCGKVVQLKPELEVVRSIPSPGATPMAVSGLCWLSTTEWLVSYSSDNLKQEAFVMTVKKDKAPEWAKLSDLGFCNPKSSLQPVLFSSTELLINWNVILVASSKFGDVYPVGKLATEWQVWIVDEGRGVNLPTTSNRQESFPLGIAIDLSSQKEVFLDPSGQKRFKPSPILLSLTSDGVLVAYHFISENPAHASCQMQSQPCSLKGAAKIVDFSVSGSVPAVKPSTSFVGAMPTDTEPTKSGSSLFGGMAAGTGMPKPASLFGGLTTSKEASQPSPLPFGEGSQVKTDAKPFSNFFSSVPKTSDTTSTATVNASTFAKPSEPLFGGLKTLSTNSASPKSQDSVGLTSLSDPKKLAQTSAATKQEEDEKKKLAEEEAKKLAEQRKTAELKNTVISRFSTINQKLKDSFSDLGQLSVGLSNVSFLVSNCVESVHFTEENVKEAVKEIDLLLSGICEGAVIAKKHIEDINTEVKDKKSLLAELNDVEMISKRLRDYDDADKQIRFTKLETSVDSLNEQYAKALTLLKTLQTAQKNVSSMFSPRRSSQNALTYEEETTVLKTTRNVSKIVLDVREKLERSERDLAIIKKMLLKKKDVRFTGSHPREVPVVKVSASRALVNGLLEKEEILALQSKIREKIRAREKNPVVTRKIASNSFAKPAPTTPRAPFKSLDTSNLSRALLNVSLTPRRTAANTTALRNTCDAATQADSPPVSLDSEKATPLFPSLSKPSQPLSSIFSKTETTTEMKPAVPSFFSSTPIAEIPLPSSEKPSSLFGTSEKKVVETPIASNTKPKDVIELPEPEVTATTPESKEPVALVDEEVSAEASGETEKKLVEEMKKEDEVVPAMPPLKEDEPKIISPPVTTSVPAPTTPSFGNVFSSAGTTAPKSLFGSMTSPAPATNSIFGGGIASTTPANTSSSIFGGGISASGNAFGSFGQTASPPVNFSFKTGTVEVVKPVSPADFSFKTGTLTQTPKTTSIFGEAKPVSEDVMEDDTATVQGSSNTGTSSLFGGGGFMSGLGGAKSSNPTANVFGKMSAGSQPSNNSWLFGGGQQQKPQQQPQSSFGSFGAAANQSQPQTSSVFGSSPQFGAASKFGAAPAFGAKPVFGSSVAQGQQSVFGGGVKEAGTAGSGFAQFAGNSQSSSIFGGGVSQQTTGTSNIFGGGSGTTDPSKSSVFGGGAKSSFTSWR
ncbi:unnamed protein product [Caenorhabditis auriculariae]|uniref:Nucleoporin Nup159/Nup146 N-terminal domain-containing protein n=1 Tax=Caenorhabditis auriculariae TaxID=2777116 RepID=A0A8S1HNT4_9PELO|nr:unnamed protein product [Caenorhabditis auriculariae]